MTKPDARIQLDLPESDLHLIIYVLESSQDEMHKGPLRHSFGYVEIPNDPAEDAAYIEDRVIGTHYSAEDVADAIDQVRNVEALSDRLRKSLPKEEENS